MQSAIRTEPHHRSGMVVGPSVSAIGVGVGCHSGSSTNAPGFIMDHAGKPLLARADQEGTGSDPDLEDPAKSRFSTTAVFGHTV